MTMNNNRRRSSTSSRNNNNNNNNSNSNKRNSRNNGSSSSSRKKKQSRTVTDDDDDTLNAQPLQPPQRSTTSNTASAAAAAGGVAMIRPPTFSSVAARRPPQSAESVDLSLIGDEDDESYVHEYHEHIAKIATTPSLTSSSNNNRNAPAARNAAANANATRHPLNSSSNASEGTASTAMPPPLAPIAREQSTPGAVAVTGVFTNPRNLEYENNDYSDIETIATRSSIPSTVGNPNQMTNLMMTSLSQPPPEPEAHIVAAELAPDEGDVAARVAERISAEMTERLKREVQQQLNERQQYQQQQQQQLQPQTSTMPIVAAERIPEEHPFNSDNAPKNTSGRGSDSNFKICGVRRSCWGIWMVFVLFVAIGAGVGIVLYQQQLIGGTDPSEGNSREPTATASPSAAPTLDDNMPTRRRDDILAVLGPYILPQSEADLQTRGSPQYRAINWMVNVDSYTTIPTSDGGDEDDDTSTTRFILERYALVVLYFNNAAGNSGTSSTDAIITTPTTNWNLENEPLQRRFGTASHCDWNTDGVGLLITETNNEENVPQGMFCQKNGEEEDDENVVTDLQFANFGLRGELPWELSLLQDMQRVDMDNNSLQGTLPLEYFRDWTSMELFWASSNRLTGTLPVSLRRWTNLQTLDLRENRMAGSLPPAWGDKLSNLFFMGLGLNRIAGSLPPSYEELTALQVWDLEGNELTGMIPTEYGSTLTKLESFFLESNGGLEGPLPSELGQLDSLKQLLVFDNRLTGSVPTSFDRLTNLDFFWFHGNLLTGSVDGIFCNDDWEQQQDVPNLAGDCLGTNPGIICTCCTSCCEGSFLDNNQTCSST